MEIIKKNAYLHHSYTISQIHKFISDINKEYTAYRSLIKIVDTIFQICDIPSRLISYIEFRDVSTGATAVAPKSSDTLTLLQPREW